MLSEFCADWWEQLESPQRWNQVEMLMTHITQWTPALPLVHLKQKLWNNACIVVCCHGYWRVFLFFFCKLNPPHQRHKPWRDDSSRCWECWTDEFSSETLRVDNLSKTHSPCTPDITGTVLQCHTNRSQPRTLTDNWHLTVIKTSCLINDQPLLELNSWTPANNNI